MFQFSPIEKAMIASMLETIDVLYDIDDMMQTSLFGSVISDSCLVKQATVLFDTIRECMTEMGVDVNDWQEEVSKLRDEKKYQEAADALEKHIRDKTYIR